MKRFSLIELSMMALLSWMLFGSALGVVSGQGNPRAQVAQEAREIPELVVQNGHAGQVRALSFSSDNKLLASAATDGTVKLWNAETGQLLRTIAASKYWVHSVAISPDGKMVAAGSGDLSVSLWDVETGKQLGVLKGHIDVAQAIAFSEDGEKLVSAAKSVTGDYETALIAVWDLRSGNKIRQIHGEGGTASKLVLLPESETVIVAVQGWDKTSRAIKSKLQMYNIATGAMSAEFAGPSGSVSALKSSRHGDIVAVAGRDRVEMPGDSSYKAYLLKPVVRTINVRTGSSGQTIEIMRDTILDVAFTNDGNTLVYFGRRGIDFRDVTTGKLLKHVAENIHNPMLGAFSSDAKLLAYATADGSVMIMDVETGSVRKKVVGRSNAVKDAVFLSDKKLLATALDAGIVSLWSLEKGVQVDALVGHTGPVNAVSFNSEGSKFASSDNEGKVIIWDVQSGGMVDTTVIPQVISGDPYQKQKYWSREKIFNKYNTRPAPPRAFRIGEETPQDPRSLFVSRYSPSEEIVALVGYKFVSLYDVKKRILHDLTTEKLAISALAFSPDGTLMAGGSETGRIDIWDMRLRQKKHSLDAHPGLVSAIAFSPDKMPILATAGNDKVINLWDPVLGKPLFSISGHSAPVAALAFGHQRAFIASGSIDGTIIISDLPSRKTVKVFRGHTSGVNVLLYTSDGKYLISGSEDGIIILWNTITYEKAVSMIPGKEGVWLAFTSEGFFDGTRSAWQLVPFRFPSEPLRLYEPEQFFTQFYQPGLLADIFREGKPIREILKARGDPRAELDVSKYRDSKLPEVRIINPEDGFTTGEREIQVTIEVKDTGSGLRDLRVFRNQTLVHFEHGELTPDPQTKKYDLPVKVKLVAGENEITAYVFNRDNIKSKDAGITVHGAKTLARKGTAYVLAVGINQYSNTDWNLNFAVNDAKGITDALGKRFKELNTYAQIVPVTLLNKEATKVNLLSAFNLLSGAITSPPPGAPDEFKKLSRAEPEDNIIIYFSGHGMAKGDRYFLIPHDMGYQGRSADLEKAGGKIIIMKHSLSDQDLNEGFEKIDAGRMMFIIDACQSGQALESEEKRRGPMNSRGLAQLAYEKGMYILAAAQSYQAAREFSSLGHGLLTYTLIEEGLKQFAADNNPKNNQITAEEWLDYAVKHVGRGVEEASAQYAKKKGGEEIDGGEATVTGQSARAYYRRERMGDPWVVTEYRLRRQ